jgi:hypothetical protein
MNLKAIKMKTVIYKECTYQIVRVVSGDINDLKDDEDFMSVDMWNSSDDRTFSNNKPLNKII